MLSEHYDTEDMSGGLYDVELNEGLSEAEIKEAEAFERLGLTRGVMLVTGAPGAGKGLFGTVLAWKIRRYFKGKRCLLDYKPKPLFDADVIEPYTLFNGDFLMSQVKNMAEAVEVSVDSEAALNKQQADKAAKIAQSWIEDQGAVLLQNGVLALDELKRYFHNRRPMNTLGIIMGYIVTIWRHLDLLIIGMTPYKKEIDQFSFLPYVTHWVRCEWNVSRPNTTTARIFRARFVGATGVFETVGKPISITLNGNEPRESLGGKRYYDLYNSKDKKNVAPAVRMKI